MQPFQYASPVTLKQALSLLGNAWGEADVLAGGTDLLGLMKDYIHTPARVVNIKGIKELSAIRKAPDGLHIGATVTLQDLIDSPLVHADYPSLVTAADGVASPQIRNMGTVGGDLCQRPRCWYFRAGFGLLAQDKDGRSLVPNGENRYHAILGNAGPAYSVSASSLAPPLIALGARLTLVSSSGKRDLDAAKFFLTPDKPQSREVDLAPSEILAQIIIPPSRAERHLRSAPEGSVRLATRHRISGNRHERQHDRKCPGRLGTRGADAVGGEKSE